MSDTKQSDNCSGCEAETKDCIQVKLVFRSVWICSYKCYLECIANELESVIAQDIRKGQTFPQERKTFL